METTRKDDTLVSLTQEPYPNKMNIEITHRHDTNKILWEGNADNLTHAVQQALKAGANLSYANLCDVDLSYANLCDVDLSYANLSSANLCDVDLRDANLCDVDLSYANLRGANLRGANLCDANLRGANLSSADLSYANLCDVDLFASIGVVTFTAGAHQAIGNAKGLSVGCEWHTWEHWLENYATIGKENGYSKSQIEIYGAMIKALILTMEK